jgi:ADP-heptose:LPS heptosyltransferase
MEFKDKNEKKTYENWKISLLQTFKEAYPEAIITFPGEKKEAPLPEPPKPQEKVIADFQKIAEEKAKKEAEAKARAEEEERLRKIEELQSQIEKIRSKVNK